MRNVGALGKVDDHGIVEPFLLIVFRQFQAQPARLQPHHRILSRVEGIRPFKDRDAQRVFLQFTAATVERLAGDVPEQPHAPFGFAETCRCGDSLQLGGNGCRIGRHDSRRVLHLTPLNLIPDYASSVPVPAVIGT